MNANELWKQQLLSHVRHGAKLRRIKKSEIFLKYFYSRKTFLQTQLYNYQTPPLGRNYPWTSGKKIIFPYTRVTGFSRETLSWTASNARQLQTISPESFPRAVWSPPGENTSQVEGRSHVADPAITHNVGGYRRSTLGGFQPFLVSVLTTSLCPNGAEITEGERTSREHFINPQSSSVVDKG